MIDQGNAVLSAPQDGSEERAAPVSFSCFGKAVFLVRLAIAQPLETLYQASFRRTALDTLPVRFG
jgi:hypothetical protein